MNDQPPVGPPPVGPPPPPPPGGWTPGPPPGPPWPPPAGPPAYPAYPPHPAYPTYPQPGQPPGEPPRRSSSTRLVLALIAGVLVLALAIVVPVVLLGGDDEDSAGGERGSTVAPQTAAPSTADTPADLAEVKSYGALPQDHVTDEVPYEQTPPVGGPHSGEWLECGAYDAPVPNENAVHDLEHGTVWITYDPDLGDDDVATLKAALPQNGIMSPYDGLPAPVVVTVWSTQLALTGADDPRLALFIEEYDDGVTAPEPFASCSGGTADGPTSA